MGAVRAIPARDDATEFPEFDRGTRFLGVLEEIGVGVAGRTVADLGTGFGSTALAAARAGATRVLALDANEERLAVVVERAARGGLDVEVVRGNLLAPPVMAASVDVAFMVGVIEYAGLWGENSPVADLQRQVLSGAWRMLRPGGVLILATKNRLWPKYAVSDPHTRQVGVNVLPRRWAVALWRRRAHQPYRHHI
jgi:2-polyprenyl-3-methyl-5-hydroxy-6-metoxy-1,4-benzoquinol methylase